MIPFNGEHKLYDLFYTIYDIPLKGSYDAIWFNGKHKLYNLFYIIYNILLKGSFYDISLKGSYMILFNLTESIIIRSILYDI